MQSQEEDTFLYFAYGSNLMSERIHLHNPSAEFCYVARLQVSAARRAPATLCPLHRRGGQDSESLHGARDAALPNESASYPHDRAAAHLGKPISLSPSYA